MKKTIAIILVLASTLCMFSVSAFASSSDVRDIIITDEKVLEMVTGLYDSEENMRSDGLILAKTLSLSKTSSQLVITAKTSGSTEVTKCGFTYIKLQRLLSGTWTDYSTYCYYDQYSNSTVKTFSKSISAPKGYTYRVVCEHYAEKPRLVFWITSETSYNVTSSLAF